ncbi:DNA repair protein recA 3 [Carex littledalei]|uniref:DNA repair protein recA 3 n=1 Tax=Carex littledalei TaxID=544730 RepID=A0A833R0D4_9POAL|nr:DNA repair protein recA 3 [Carex littledalei]
MSQALRKLSHSLSCSQTILIFVNQVRAKLNTFGGFGAPTEVTCGGNALKFYASVRLNTRPVGFIRKGEEVVGIQIQVKIVKNKHAPPFKTIQLELEFGKGISRDSEVIDLGSKHNLITKAGGSYYSIGGHKFNGKDAIKRYFHENEGVREELIMKLREMLQKELHKNDFQSNLPDERESEEEVVTEVEA